MFLIAGSLLVLIDPGLTPVFRPFGALHGPVNVDGPSQVWVRICATALLLIGVRIGFCSLHQSRK